MKKYFLSGLLAATVSLASPGFSDTKPKGAKPTDPNRIAALYAGKTSHWSRGGFAYWGPGGEYQGLGKAGDSVGIGKWYVTTRGKLCHESNWYWHEQGKPQNDSGKWCWDFVTAPDGTIWERFQEDKGNWYRHNREKQHAGNTQRRKINALRSKLGV